MDGRFDVYIRPGRGLRCGADARRPHAGDRRLAVRGARGPNEHNVEGNYLKALDLQPEFAERVRGATPRRRASRAQACRTTSVGPTAPGWALVGDAGYNKDFVTAQGILDAFRDAELCATALHESFSGTRSFDEAMADYHGDPRRAGAADVRVHLPAGDAGAAGA